ncbi:hypothetical protein [Streptomyces sp. NPDC017993]|uniref:hypothetical protein n=1 Tax=Streptomyces sp. NPDC017993 TaxID=3365027 RepID=UPI0037A1097D
MAVADPYPHLGWNPVPGELGEIQALASKIKKSADALDDAHQRIKRLLGESDQWQGDAAKAFREALDGDLPTYLMNANHSLRKALKQLDNWHDDLNGYQETAQKYDDAAREKKTALTAAKSHHEAAKSNPDLKLAHQHFESKEALDAAQARLDSAGKELTNAGKAVDNAQDALDDIIKKAHELESTHRDQSSVVAKGLNDATDKLAPKEPGWLSKALSSIGEALKDLGSWLKEHAGTIGAIAGLLALIPGPWSPALLAVSVLCSAVQLGNDIQGGALKDLAQWPPNMKTLGAATSIGGDVLGVLPGVGVAARAASGTIKGAKAAAAAGKALSATETAAQFGKNAVKVTSRVAHSGASGAGAMERGLAGGGAGTTLYADLVEHKVIGENDTRDNANQVGNSASTFNKPAYSGAVDVANDVKNLATAVFK